MSELSRHLARQNSSPMELTISSLHGWELNSMIRGLLLACLKAHGWNRLQTSYALGVSVRSLRNFIEELKANGIDVPDNPKTAVYQARLREKKCRPIKTT